ncbi:MAG: tRNA (adenosine(37)-N6)-threonylcarbamoyltransferase complex ATPase subunit type 1 TsaE [bacterium]
MERIYTQNDIQAIARDILANIELQEKQGHIIALEGDLGAGKTTLTKTLARELGIDQEITSPTFVVAKSYETNGSDFTKVTHIDAYRIEDLSELKGIGFAELLQDPKTLIIVEWPELIAPAITEHPHLDWYTISHIDETTRKITKKI